MYFIFSLENTTAYAVSLNGIHSFNKTYALLLFLKNLELNYFDINSQTDDRNST